MTRNEYSLNDLRRMLEDRPETSAIDRWVEPETDAADVWYNTLQRSDGDIRPEIDEISFSEYIRQREERLRQEDPPDRVQRSIRDLLIPRIEEIDVHPDRRLDGRWRIEPTVSRKRVRLRNNLEAGPRPEYDPRWLGKIMYVIDVSSSPYYTLQYIPNMNGGDVPGVSRPQRESYNIPRREKYVGKEIYKDDCELLGDYEKKTCYGCRELALADGLIFCSLIPPRYQLQRKYDVIRHYASKYTPWWCPAVMDNRVQITHSIEREIFEI